MKFEETQLPEEKVLTVRNDETVVRILNQPN
jgi:hypothetical protein